MYIYILPKLTWLQFSKKRKYIKRLEIQEEGKGPPNQEGVPVPVPDAGTISQHCYDRCQWRTTVKFPAQAMVEATGCRESDKQNDNELWYTKKEGEVLIFKINKQLDIQSAITSMAGAEDPRLFWNAW